MHKPHPNCYWAVPGRLLAGEYPRNLDARTSPSKLAAILDSGIDSFLDLTGPADGLAPYHEGLLPRRFAHHRFWIPDLDVPSPELMTSIQAHLAAELQAGRNVYLHCWGGIGRTGTVMGCYWVEQGLSGVEALARIASHWQEVAKRRRFPRSPETDAQVDYVLRWQPALRK